MVTRADQTMLDPYERLEQRIRDLERDMRELRAARRLESASIGAGGLRIKDGGTVIVDDDTGAPMIWLGKVPFGDGTTKPGMVAFRSQDAGGQVAMSLYDGVFAVWDRQGHIVMATDEVSGQGIALPCLPVPFAPLDFTVWPGTNAVAFTRVVEAQVVRQQPNIYVTLAHTTDVSGTTGQARLTCNGVPIGPTLNVGFVIAYGAIGPVALPPGDWGSTLELAIEARVTAGTGKVRAAVTSAFTLQS